MFLLRKKIFFLGLLLVSMSSYGSDCYRDSLSKNSNGEILQTLSGGIYQTLAGDNITAYLWLPMSDLVICGPRRLEHQGKTYELFDISNIDGGEKVTAFSLGGSPASSQSTGCYESQIMQPTPFLGNNDEIFILGDGAVWQIKYEYEYMYEYYPSVLVCESQGYVIVDGKKLNAIRIK